MAAFRGLVQGGRGEASRLGHKSTGMRVEAQSWQGKVVTSLRIEGETVFATVTVRPHMGHGPNVVLYDGPIDVSNNYSTDLA